MPKVVKTPVQDEASARTVYFLNNIQNISDKVREGVLPASFLADQLDLQIVGIMDAQGYTLRDDSDSPISENA